MVASSLQQEEFQLELSCFTSSSAISRSSARRRQSGRIENGRRQIWQLHSHSDCSFTDSPTISRPRYGVWKDCILSLNFPWSPCFRTGTNQQVKVNSKFYTSLSTTLNTAKNADCVLIHQLLQQKLLVSFSLKVFGNWCHHATQITPTLYSMDTWKENFTSSWYYGRRLCDGVAQK